MFPRRYFTPGYFAPRYFEGPPYNIPIQPFRKVAMIGEYTPTKSLTGEYAALKGLVGEFPPTREITGG